MAESTSPRIKENLKSCKPSNNLFTAFFITWIYYILNGGMQMPSFLYIAWCSHRKIIRTPYFSIVTILTLSMIGLFPSLSLFVFNEQNKMILDSSLATTMMFGFAIAAISASSIVSDEINNGTFLLIISKPISYIQITSAKAVGLCYTLTLFVAICYLGTISSLYFSGTQFKINSSLFYMFFLTIAISCIISAVNNFIRKVSFSATLIYLLLLLFLIFDLSLFFTDMTEHLSLFLLPGITLSFLFIIYAVCLMGVLACTISVNLSLVPMMIICTLFFILGLCTEYFIMKFYNESYLISLVYVFIPNWQYFWVADSLGNKEGIPIIYTIWVTIYTFLYLFLNVITSTVLLSRKEPAKLSSN